jgi:NAD(P)-dependent dehydrogenase (short-subunit alcohol dehydrogenase family)
MTMAGDGCVVIIGGNRGIAREVAKHYADAGVEVIVTCTGVDRAVEAAKEIGGNTRGLAVDLTEPATIGNALSSIGPVQYLVIAAINRDDNPVRDYSWQSALQLVTMKLVGYTETVHVLLDRLRDDSAICLFGGLAKDRPYPGSTTVSSVNGGIVGLTRTLATELAPIRVNAIHPGLVADSPYWKGKNLDHIMARTPTKRLVTMDDVTDAVVFLLENRSINGIDLRVDAGWMIT